MFFYPRFTLHDFILRVSNQEKREKINDKTLEKTAKSLEIPVDAIEEFNSLTTLFSKDNCL
jgi:hypothetical protein